MGPRIVPSRCDIANMMKATVKQTNYPGARSQDWRRIEHSHWEGLEWPPRED